MITLTTLSITNSELVIYDRRNATSRFGLEDDSGYIAINSTDGGTADANDYIINETLELITFVCKYRKGRKGQIRKLSKVYF